MSSAHLQHLAAGHCPAVHDSKTWCNLPMHHTGDHGAVFALPPGHELGVSSLWMEWAGEHDAMRPRRP